MDEQRLAEIAATWTEIMEQGADYGPDHCSRCEERWVTIVDGVPALVAEVRRLRQALEELADRSR